MHSNSPVAYKNKITLLSSRLLLACLQLLSTPEEYGQLRSVSRYRQTVQKNVINSTAIIRTLSFDICCHP